ncbi:MAG: hypothetical protein Q8J93_15215 [Xanthomonadales bacterium]|nr:hypothetical protein [Xanthomonadales bacterium]MDZ4378767.1 hypothetical protein [Xanthomonadaceae bacterium]
MAANAAINLLRWPIIGLLIATGGGVLNVLGWYVFDSRILSLMGFYVAAMGIVLGIVGIIFGQVIATIRMFRKNKK